MKKEWLANYPLRVLLVLAVLIHGLLLCYDISIDFAPFVHGDRSFVRFEIMQHVVQSLSGDGLGPVGLTQGINDGDGIGAGC